MTAGGADGPFAFAGRQPMRTSPSLIVLALLAAAPATRPTQSFDSSEYGFRLRVPVAWVVPERPDEGQAFTAHTPPLATTRPADRAGAVGVVSLKVGDGPEGATDPQILREGSDLLAATVFEHGGLHVTIRPGSLGTVAARRVRYTVDRPDGRVDVLTVIAVRKRVTYALTVAAPAGRLNELMPDVEPMLASFDLRE